MCGEQFNLFGGTVMKLGTDRHHGAFLDRIDSLKGVGCFALTELGYGNNAVEMETTAILDKATDEWVINTPSTVAQKYWITNGSIYAQWAVVFAQLIVDGKKCVAPLGSLDPHPRNTKTHTYRALWLPL
jgi:acyl-CoA oxidase